MSELNQELIKKALECCGEEIICGVENGEKTYYVSFAEILDFINELTEKKKNLEYTLAGVMHSVDKWLDGAELEQDEVNRAITMRDKTLRLCETLDCMIDNLRDDIDELTAENERLRAIPEQLFKEMSERMVEERKIERKLVVQKMEHRLINYESYDNGGGNYVVSVCDIRTVAKDISEGKI